MKYTVIILCLVLGVILGLLSGCSEPASDPKYKIVCLEGVAYWQGSEGGVAPKYSAEYDMPDTCS